MKGPALLAAVDVLAGESSTVFSHLHPAAMFRVFVFAVLLVATSADQVTENSVPSQASQFMPSAHKVEQPIVYNLQGNQESKSSNSLTGNPSLSSVLTLNLNNLALVGLFLIGVFILLPSIIGFLTGLTGGTGSGPSSYGQNLLSSYKLKDAVDRGRSGADCDSFYTRCPYSVGNLSKLISTYYSGFAGFNSNPFMTKPN
uniref:Uncharacterized protein n=1 Tax=Strigamia maritima TaxID=126957 RepID=T1IMR8_STRMM